MAATTSQTFNSSNGLVTSSVSVHGATTSYSYVFNPTIVTATTNSHWSKSYRDGFGRDLADETGTGSTIVSHTDNTYGSCACSPLGKVTATSQPYAISGGQITATDGTSNIAWTHYVYDGRGRTVTQTAPDGSVTTYYYLGNTAKIADPAGNWKRYTSDTLGNLTKVEEPNPAYGQTDNISTNFVTTYSYDVEAHLIQVQMPRPNGGGSYTQTRTFNYDLPTGHLLSSVNPENGAVTYAYYPSGRLLSRTDAKGQKVTYSYDGYGRVTYIDRYPDGVTWDQCHSVALTYDSSGTNVMGRIAVATTGNTTACASDLTENYSYTPGGLVTAKGYNINIPTACDGYQCSNEYFQYSYAPSATFTYDNEGHPTGYNTFAYTLDAIGRPTGLTETGPGTAWVQSAAYGPGGELKTMQFRTTSSPYPYYTQTNTYNNRAQLKQLQTGGTGLTGINLQYTYPSGSNNGQISQMTDSISGEQVTYTYDSLKRLIQAQTVASGGWGQSFGYDGWGNLVSKTPTSGHTGTSMSLSMDVTTNHVTTSGFAYDANGNTTSIPSTPQNINLTYDEENRTGGTWYDLQNQPLDRTGVWNLYGLRGERLGTYTYSVAWQYQPQGSILVGLATVTTTQASRNIYFGKRLIHSNGTTVVTDRLGSVRANENGQALEYYPYGEEVTVQNPQDREKFATYTRESSTGLDYADQRYYASVYGRFNTPDPYGGSAKAGNPGSWNRYSYVLGDPVNSSDPSGLGGDGCSDGTSASDQGVCEFDYYDNDPDPSDNPNINPGATSVCYSTGNGYCDPNATGTSAIVSTTLTFDGFDGSSTFVSNQMFGSDGDTLEFSTSPIVSLPNSFFILPNGMGPITRIFGPDGNVTVDIDYQPNHPDVGDPHIHWWNTGMRGAPEAAPPAVPARPAVPPGAQGPYSPWPQEPVPVIPRPSPVAGPNPGLPIIITINPCLSPALRRSSACSAPVQQ